MKKWKKCPLLIVTAISMLLVSGVALAGTRGAYKEYNKDWPKVPAVAGMMQASKEGILPWDRWNRRKIWKAYMLTKRNRQRKRQQKQLRIPKRKRIRHMKDRKSVV